MNPQRVVITGMGALTPLGSDYETIARRLLAGESGVRAIRHFDTKDYACRIAGQIAEIACPKTETPDDFARLTRWQRLMTAALTQALTNAGLWETRTALRIAIVSGIGAEWPQVWEVDHFDRGDMIRRPDAAPLSLPEWTCRRLELTGPVAVVGAACASGNFALAQARQWLRLGWVDVCIAGGADLPVTRLGVASFGNLGALSKRNDAPVSASRPFDKNRDGFVLGEGAAFFVVERERDARARGAKLWAELAGFGASSDAAHLVAPSTDATAAARAMRAAFADAQVEPAEIDYVNAHATSTTVGDKFETQALKTVLGSAVTETPVSGTKSMSGHMLSAASAFETLACIVAMDKNSIPPTINLDEPDPDCDLRHVPHRALPRRVDIALNNSFGFGGSNTCLVLRKCA